MKSMSSHNRSMSFRSMDRPVGRQISFSDRSTVTGRSGMSAVLR